MMCLKAGAFAAMMAAARLDLDEDGWGRRAAFLAASPAAARDRSIRAPPRVTEKPLLTHDTRGASRLRERGAARFHVARDV
jgi:hypothetical protein